MSSMAVPQAEKKEREKECVCMCVCDERRSGTLHHSEENKRGTKGEQGCLPSVSWDVM